MFLPYVPRRKTFQQLQSDLQQNKDNTAIDPEENTK